MSIPKAILSLCFAALVLVACSEDAGEAEQVPDALDPNVHERVAEAVREASVASGVAHPEWVPAGL